MVRARYSDIKQTAKKKMEGHFGEVFLAIVLIPFLFSMGRSVISLSLSSIPIVDYIISFFILVFIQYITINFAIKISKRKFEGLFSNIFGTKFGYLNMLIYVGVVSVFSLLPTIIYIGYVNDISAYLSALDPNAIPDPGVMNDFFIDSLPHVGLMGVSFVLSIFALIVSIRLFITPYLIVDRDMKAFDAMKMSWEYTSGNFFRIFFFPISFFLWILLVVITCGLALIYVIPYVTIATTILYRNIMRENGNPVKEEIEEKIIDEYDPLAEEKKIDPFGDYYE